MYWSGIFGLSNRCTDCIPALETKYTAAAPALTAVNAKGTLTLLFAVGCALTAAWKEYLRLKWHACNNVPLLWFGLPACTAVCFAELLAKDCTVKKLLAAIWKYAEVLFAHAKQLADISFSLANYWYELFVSRLSLDAFFDIKRNLKLWRRKSSPGHPLYLS